LGGGNFAKQNKTAIPAEAELSLKMMGCESKAP